MSEHISKTPSDWTRPGSPVSLWTSLLRTLGSPLTAQTRRSTGSGDADWLQPLGWLLKGELHRLALPQAAESLHLQFALVMRDEAFKGLDDTGNFFFQEVILKMLWGMRSISLEIIFLGLALSSWVNSIGTWNVWHIKLKIERKGGVEDGSRMSREWYWPTKNVKKWPTRKSRQYAFKWSTSFIKITLQTTL